MRIPIPVRTKTTKHHTGTISNVECPKCKNNTSYLLIKSITTTSVMFIPFIKGADAAYVCCSECGAIHQVDIKDFNNLSNSNDVQKAIAHYYDPTLAAQRELDFKKKRRKLRIFSVVLMIIGLTAPISSAISTSSSQWFVLFNVFFAIGILLFIRSFSKRK